VIKKSELPEGWGKATIGEVCEILAGYGFPKDLQGKASGDLPFYKVGDISQAWLSGNRYLVKANNYLSQEEAKKIKAKTLPAGTTVMAKIGEAIKLNRRALLAKPSLVDNNVMGIYPKPAYVDPRYNFYYLMTISLGDYSQATTVPSVRKTDVSEIFFPLAPLDQQKRIVAEIEKQFSRLDEAVAALKRIEANLKRYKASVLKAAIEGKLTEEWRSRRGEPACSPSVGSGQTHGPAPTKDETGAELLKRILVERRKKWEEDYVKKYIGAHGHAPKDDSWKKKYKEPAAPDTSNLPKLPNGWVWATVEQLATKVQYGSSSKTNENSSGISVLRMGNIFEGRLGLDDLKYLPQNHSEIPDLLLEEGDLLFNRTNSPELVGKSAVYLGKPKPCSFASYLIRVQFNKKVNSSLISFYVNSIHGRNWIKAVVSQQVGQANVNGTKLQALAVPLPPQIEQNEIVEEVERCLSVAEEIGAAVETNLKRAYRLRQSILKEAFEGNLI